MIVRCSSKSRCRCAGAKGTAAVHCGFPSILLQLPSVGLRSRLSVCGAAGDLDVPSTRLGVGLKCGFVRGDAFAHSAFPHAVQCFCTTGSSGTSFEPHSALGNNLYHGLWEDEDASGEGDDNNELCLGAFFCATGSVLSGGDACCLRQALLKRLVGCVSNGLAALQPTLGGLHVAQLAAARCA